MLFWANSFITARTLVLFGFEGRKFLTILGNVVHFEKNQSYEKNVKIETLGPFFLFFNEKIRRIPSIFDIEK